MNDGPLLENAVIAAVVKRGLRYLICQRPLHKRHGGLWEFPGGKIEPGETLFDAACRELREELAMEVLEVGAVRLALKDDVSGLTINFVDVVADRDPQLLEHNALRWCTPHELLKLNLAPTDREFAERLRKSGG
jgi:8-oxo-dGTP diphosphatase